MTLEYTLEGRPLSWKRVSLHNGRTVVTSEQRNAKAAHCYAALAARPRGWDLGATYEVEVSAFVFGRHGDVDNYGKLVLDALNGSVWNDDSQVRHLDTWKHRVASEREQRTHVTVRRLPEVAT